MDTIETGGQKYRIGKLTATQQFHVGRRVAPVIAIMGISFAGLGTRKIDVNELLPSLAPATQVLAAMRDEDVDYVIATCLGVVQRREDAGAGNERWATVSREGRIMYADIQMLDMIRLCIAVMQDNMGDFFVGLFAPTESKSS